MAGYKQGFPGRTRDSRKGSVWDLHGGSSLPAKRTWEVWLARRRSARRRRHTTKKSAWRSALGIVGDELNELAVLEMQQQNAPCRVVWAKVATTCVGGGGRSRLDWSMVYI